MKIVRIGNWLYDGTVEMPVDIVAMDFDWWFELAKADDQLDPGEQPEPLSEDGFLYYVRFRHALDPSVPTWVDSCGYPTVGQAVKWAEKKVVGDVKWRCS